MLFSHKMTGVQNNFDGVGYHGLHLNTTVVTVLWQLYCTSYNIACRVSADIYFSQEQCCI